MSVNGTVFESNTAWNGGAIVNDGGTFVLSNSKLKFNRAQQSGGAICVTKDGDQGGASLTVASTYFSNDAALPGQGDDISKNNGTTVTFISCNGAEIPMTDCFTLPPLPTCSWTGLQAAIAGGSSSSSGGGALEITLALLFDTSDYQQQITIPRGANITILGQGAVLDAAGKGRFFNMPANASLALDSLTLRNVSLLFSIRDQQHFSPEWFHVRAPYAGKTYKRAGFHAPYTTERGCHLCRKRQQSRSEQFQLHVQHCRLGQCSVFVFHM
jgi:hypothetical protein